LNPRPVDRKSNALPITPPRQLVRFYAYRSSLLSGRNARLPHRILPMDSHGITTDGRTDARPLHYAFCYRRGQCKNWWNQIHILAITLSSETRLSEISHFAPFSSVPFTRWRDCSVLMPPNHAMAFVAVVVWRMHPYYVKM